MSFDTRLTAPEGYNVVNPYITARDVAALVQFLQRTFGGVVSKQITQPDGAVEHVEVAVGDSLLMIGPPEVDALVRSHEANRPGTFYVFVADVDATYAQAMACGAGAWAPPSDAFYGDRIAAVTDTNGNAWWIATRKEILSAAQLQARADQRWHSKAPAVDLSRVEQRSGSAPGGYRMINSYLTVKDVDGLIDFVKSTFGGILTGQIRQPDGRIEHAELRIGDAVLMIGPPQVDALIPSAEHQRPGTFYVFVPDVDDTCRKASDRGARVLEPPTERFYGDRVAEIRDPYGNRWWIATRKETLTPKELQERAEEHWHARSRAVSRTVTKGELLDYMRVHRYGVEATVTAQGAPQAALVGFVVNDQLELFFDSFASTRKVANLKRDSRMAFVIGGHTLGDERTVQYEGVVDSPSGAELDAFKDAYFALHPDGIRRSRLAGISYFRVRPRWIRYTNFNAAPPQIVVFEGAVLSAHPQEHGAPAVSHYTQLKAPWQPKVDRDREFNAFSSSTRASEAAESAEERTE
jgi:uncharacterized glyoxalase superfamily protein PhnB